MAQPSVTTPKIDNRKARHEFEIIEQVEAGIALTGSEVKSLRNGRCSIDEAYAVIRQNEAFLRDLNISPYEMAGYAQHTPKRERKLLLHRRQIKKWHEKVTQKGLTLVPLSVYFSERGLVKVKLGLARGKKTHDKRATIKEREVRREMDRAIKHFKR